jgi:hypothetical protein
VTILSDQDARSTAVDYQPSDNLVVTRFINTGEITDPDALRAEYLALDVDMADTLQLPELLDYIRQQGPRGPVPSWPLGPTR